MDKTKEEQDSEKSSQLRAKLEELRQSRETTEQTLSDCRLRLERMKEEDMKFMDPEETEELLGEQQNNCGYSDRTLAIEELLLKDRTGEKDKDDEEPTLCGVLNQIWMEIIGLVLTLYTVLRMPKRKV